MLYHDHFQNYKVYQIPKAQLIIADIPYNIGKNAYGSNPSWYIDGDRISRSEVQGVITEARMKVNELIKKIAA